MRIKATAAFSDWMKDVQAEQYVKQLRTQADELLTELFAVCAVATDPAVRAAYAKFKLVGEHVRLLENLRKEKVEDDE